MDTLPWVSAEVDRHANEITQLSDAVWDAAEIGFTEFKSVDAFMTALQKEGFTCQSGLAGMPTAFSASYGSGKPIIGLLAEFDALPALGQESGSTTHCPVGSAGHGCGHNMLGAGSFGAAVAVKNYLTERGCSGTVVLFGCPAEENGCGKTFMAREGVFNDLDAAFCWHPMDSNCAWTKSTLANTIATFHFHGKTAHAAAAPEEGRSALDAAELMNTGVQYLREHIISDARVHYAFLDVGGDAPNVVQDTSCLKYFIRAPKSAQSREIFGRVQDVARGAAIMTGTTVDWQVISGLSDYQPNHVLTDLLQECFTQVGAPPFDEQDQARAAEFFKNAYPADTLQTRINAVRSAFGDRAADALPERPLCDFVSPIDYAGKPISGSTDVGDVSYVVPTAQLTCDSYAVGTQGHTWQLTAQGKLPAAHKATLTVSKVLALACTRLYEDHSLTELAKKEFQSSFDGAYICPIPADVKPV